MFLLPSLGGPEGHAYINRSAALKAPVGLRGFPSFFQSPESIQTITYNGPEPDRWKGSPGYTRGKGHSLAHYINLDLIQDLLAERDPIIAMQTYQEKGLDSRTVELPPYYIIETYERIT